MFSRADICPLIPFMKCLTEISYLTLGGIVLLTRKISCRGNRLPDTDSWTAKQENPVFHLLCRRQWPSGDEQSQGSCVVALALQSRGNLLGRVCSVPMLSRERNLESSGAVLRERIQEEVELFQSVFMTVIKAFGWIINFMPKKKGTHLPSRRPELNDAWSTCVYINHSGELSCKHRS